MVQMMIRRVVVLLVLVGISAGALALAGCNSAMGPGHWEEIRYRDVRYRDLERSIRAVMAQKFQYKIINRVEDERKQTITFETDWNYRDAGFAVFSSQGVRRRAWIEVLQVYEDDDKDVKVAPTTRGRKGGKVASDPEPAQAVAAPTRLKLYETFGGRKQRVVCEVAISVRRERNVSIRNPSHTDLGDWEDAGDDEDEVKRILTEIRDRVRDITGTPVGPSERGLEAHRRYFDKSESPEEWHRTREREREAAKDERK